MNRYVCIHGHFYQPPRENPWLEYVEIQDSAYPYHDWNERITAECLRSERPLANPQPGGKNRRTDKQLFLYQLQRRTHAARLARRAGSRGVLDDSPGRPRKPEALFRSWAVSYT